MNVFDTHSRDFNIGVLPPFVMGSVVEGLHPNRLSADHSLLDQVVKHYRQSLLGSTKAISFLRERFISEEVTERLGLGYSDRTLGKFLPNGETDEGGYLRGLLQRKGLLLKTGHERMRGSLVVPDQNAHGEYTQFYGRKITPDLKWGTDYDSYCCVQGNGFFNHSALDQSKDIILSQNALEMAITMSAGLDNVVSIPHLRGFDEYHLKAMEDSKVERVFLAFENTEAGRYITGLIAQSLMAGGILCYCLPWPSRARLETMVKTEGLSAIHEAMDNASLIHPVDILFSAMCREEM